MINEIVDALPLSDSGGAKVTRQIEEWASPATAFGLISLLVFGWAATGMMASLRAGLEVAACTDYQAFVDEYERLLGPAPAHGLGANK